MVVEDGLPKNRLFDEFLNVDGPTVIDQFFRFRNVCSKYRSRASNSRCDFSSLEVSSFTCQLVWIATYELQFPQLLFPFENEVSRLTEGPETS